MTTYHLTVDGTTWLCGAHPDAPAVGALEAHRALDDGEYCAECETIWRELCLHPVLRQYGWVIDDPGEPVLCVGCCDCGRSWVKPLHDLYTV